MLHIARGSKLELDKIRQDVERLECHGLTFLSSEIGQLRNLQWLYLPHNRLTSLPSEIGQLQNLYWFYCYDNLLTFLPSEIGQLHNLYWFYCSDNRLTSLPSEIGQLQNLQKFDCSRNQLTSLPSEIGQLQNLQQFGCFHNQLTFLSTSLTLFIKRYNLDLNHRFGSFGYTNHKFKLFFNRNELIISFILIKFTFRDICFPSKIMKMILSRLKMIKQ